MTKRNKAIHKATPDVLDMLFALDNVCGFCGKEIESIADAEIDHYPVTVNEFARGPPPLDEAIRQANDISNLRAVHVFCNKQAGGRIGGPVGGLATLEKQLGIHATGMNAIAGRIGGRISGPMTCHNRWHVARGIPNPDCVLCQERS